MLYRQEENWTPALWAKARRLDAMAPGADRCGSGRPLHRRLTRGYAKALRGGTSSRTTLRRIVIETGRHGMASGLTREEVRQIMTDFLASHALRDELEHVSMIDGRRASDRLLADVRRWLEDDT